MKQVYLTISLVLTMVAGSANASNVHWGGSGGQVWKTPGGECWGSPNKGAEDAGGCGGEEPAPEPVMAAAPDLDTDKDGVPNAEDVCWDTPLGDEVDLYGCTIVMPEVILSLEGVHFETDSAALTSEAKSILDGAVQAINASSSSNLNVEGHTDSRASDSYNQDLSERRAQAVVDYLVGSGVSSSRLNAVGFGESNPVASNDTRDGRAKNRRVEIIAN